MTNSIFKLSELYMNKINNIYVENKITGSMVTKKILHYYDILDSLISNKYKAVEEKEYKAYKSLLRRNEQKNYDKQMKILKEGYKLISEKDAICSNQNQSLHSFDILAMDKYIENTQTERELQKNPNYIKYYSNYYEYVNSDKYNKINNLFRITKNKKFK
jgi:hypothetical protein